MAFKRAKARIGERSITSGTGPWVLSGALDPSHNTFASYLSDGDSIEITALEPGVAFWAGIGTYTASTNSIAPTTIEESHGSFGANTKEIFAGPLPSRHLLKEDMAGAIVTGGTSTAYTVASFRNYDTLTRLHGQAIAFSPHVINGQTVTLNVDGLGAKPLRKAPGVELQSNVLIAGTPYTALYSNVDQSFYLHAFGDAPGIPIGAGCDYFAATTPSTHFAFPQGQAISRTSFAALFALIGTTYGVGDGSTTFNLPDLRGKVRAMVQQVGMGGPPLSSSFFGGNPTVLGATGGGESETLTLAQLPTGINSAGNNSITVAPTTGWNVPATQGGITGQRYNNGTGVLGNNFPTSTSGGVGDWASIGFNGTNTIGVTSNNTSGAAHNIVQPTIITNYIIRVL